MQTVRRSAQVRSIAMCSYDLQLNLQSTDSRPCRQSNLHKCTAEPIRYCYRQTARRRYERGVAYGALNRSTATTRLRYFSCVYSSQRAIVSIGLDQELLVLLQKIQQMPSLRRLDIGKTMETRNQQSVVHRRRKLRSIT